MGRKGEGRREARGQKRNGRGRGREGGRWCGG